MYSVNSVYSLYSVHSVHSVYSVCRVYHVDCTNLFFLEVFGCGGVYLKIDLPRWAAQVLSNFCDELLRSLSSVLRVMGQAAGGRCEKYEKIARSRRNCYGQ